MRYIATDHQCSVIYGTGATSDEAIDDAMAAQDGWSRSAFVAWPATDALVDEVQDRCRRIFWDRVDGICWDRVDGICWDRVDGICCLDEEAEQLRS